MARVAKSPAIDAASRSRLAGATPVHPRPSSSIPGLPARSASSRARLNPRSLDFIMTEFLQEYPLLEEVVFMESMGLWSIRGRQVAEIRSEAPLKGVSVDGVHRPLGDVLEEVLKEHQLEISMQAQSQRSQRLLTLVFQQRDRQASRRLLQSAWRGFQAAAHAGRRVRHAVVRKWLILLRNSFLSWRGRVWRQHRRLQDLEIMGDRHAAPIFRGLLWYAWHSWLAVCFQPQNQELSFRQREMLLGAVKVMKACPGSSLVPEVFQRWRLQVQNDRRTLAEQVLLADAGRLRREMAAVKRSASAKELLSHVLQGPEAQLSRLDTVVDQLIGQMDTVRSVGGLTGSLRLARSGATSPASPGSPARPDVLQEALLGLGSMLEAQKAASTLRSDLHFVLCLRCLSAWIRYVSDERFSRREAELLSRRNVQRGKLQSKARDVVSQMARMALESRLRSTFQHWDHLVREGRDAFRSNRERTVYAQQLWTWRSVAKDRALRQAKLWELRNDEMLMQLMVERWRAAGLPAAAPTAFANAPVAAAPDEQRRAQQKEQRLAASLAAFGSSSGLQEVTKRALLYQSFQLWQMKVKSFKAAALQVATVLKSGEVIYLHQALLAWRSSRRRSKAKALGFKVAADCDSFLLSTCLHHWRATVRREAGHRLRNNAKVKALRAAAQKIALSSQALLQVVFSRWLEVIALVSKEEAKFRAARLRMLQEHGKQILFHIVRDMDVAVVWSFFKEWHALAHLIVEERKTAAEFLRRQRLLDVERRQLHFQTEIRPKIRHSVERVIEMSEAMNASEVFDRWRERSFKHRLLTQSLRRSHLRDREDALKFLLEAWRCGCIRSWLRGAGLRLGQAVVRWGNAAVLQAALAIWRTICLKHHTQFTAQQLFAAQSIGRGIEQSQRNALRHWSAQALRMATAQMQKKVNKMDMLHLATLFNSNVDAEVEQRHWRLRTIFEAWRLGRQQMMLERVGGSATGLREPGSRLDMQSRAIRRLARWRRVPEEPLASLPEAFAAWTVVALQQRMRKGLQAGRCNAWRVQQRAVTLQRHFLLFHSFWSLASARNRSASCLRVAQLCRAVELFSTRQVMLQWSQVIHSKWHSRTHREKQLFKAQATGIVRRVLRLAGLEHSNSFLQSCLLRWRQQSLKPRKLLRHQAERCGQRHNRWDEQRLKAKIFGRWARSSFYSRKESLLSPKAVTFTAWKAFICGLHAQQPRSQGPLQELEGPGHAALVLRMALLKRRCVRVQLRGVEATLELRRQRQALCFGLWRFRLRFHRLHQRVMTPRLGRGLGTSMLRAAFALWAHLAERAASAQLRRSALVEAVGHLTLRTLNASFREVLLRKVWMSWLRACPNA